MFARAGIENPTDWTYEEYADIARRLTQDTDGDGVPNIWGAQWHIQSNTGIGPIIAAHSDWPVYLTDPFDTIVNTIEVQKRDRRFAPLDSGDAHPPGTGCWSSEFPRWNGCDEPGA